MTLNPLLRHLVDLLAEQYPSPAAARTLWLRAGGRAGDVPHGIERPRDMWQTMVAASANGARPAVVTLVAEALADYPSNPVLISVIRQGADPAFIDLGEGVVARLEALPKQFAYTQLESALAGLPADEPRVIEILAPALDQRLTAEKRGAILSTLGSAGKAAAATIIEAVTKGAMKAILATHGIT